MRPLTDLARHSQRGSGAALRARVAGDDAAERAQVIWGREGERWFTPEDPVWRVHADAAMFPGGVAALLLQSLHPLAMAGVAGHSGYKRRPVGPAAAHLALPRDDDLRHRRGRRGRDRAGARHPRAGARQATRRAAPTAPATRTCCAGCTSPRRTASSPPTSATPCEPLTAGGGRHLRRAVGPGRGPARGDRPPDDGGRASAPPSTAYRPELEATDEAREAARFLLLDPPLPWVARPGYGLIATGRRRACCPAGRGGRCACPLGGPGASARVGGRPGTRHRAPCAGRWPGWPRSVSSPRRGPDPHAGTP